MNQRYDDAFGIIIDTEQPGNIGNNRQFAYYAEGNYIVKWENKSKNATTGGMVLDFDMPGIHEIQFIGGLERFAMLDNERDYNCYDWRKILSIEQWGNIKWKDMSYMFFGCTNITANFNDVPITKEVTNIRGMFANALNFNDTFPLNETGACDDMSSLFYMNEKFNGNLDNLDVGNVRDMSRMFMGAKSFIGDLSGWDVSNVIDMSGMFMGAKSFNGDLSGWNVSNVRDMSGMFMGAESFNGDLSGWDVGNVRYMGEMFMGAESFSGDLSGWNVSNVRNMNRMFYFARSFNADLSDWDIRMVKDDHQNFDAVIHSWVLPRPVWEIL